MGRFTCLDKMFIAVFCFTIVLVFLLVWFAIPSLIRLFATRRLAALCADKKAIVLTYDDGPNAQFSPDLMNLLKVREVPATFFLLGNNARLHPELVKRLGGEGHEIGSHTRDHSNAWKTAPWVAVNDIRAGNDALVELGAHTNLFRPPFGKTTFVSLLYGLFRHLKFAFWTIDSRDSWDRRPVEDVIEMVKTQGGGVVLMHDFDAPKRGPSPHLHQEYILKLTEALIDFGTKNGFQFIHFSDLFETQEPVFAAGLE